ncbi:diacylglycerol kinase [Streptomyces nitrosporeus]|uniref:Diacylglycerol kinase n=1 Tax=Streptomyces nitrosporeus TaxID=28894 RepID=A0A5J6FCA9_9ACTN|nr:diacylglycerol kinase [Streptomyces nitrosporeus]QEU73683.1 diacylglycerol kinase [Streptomyces nitrosporeus]GGZ12070.1 diacylglycerol kinase [Streptomyces nitrosporeus]
MSAAEPPGDGDHQLLVLVDPLARRSDGESVRIAKDVLSAGADAKICFADGPEEFARALARRGSRRPVVVGDDRALLRAVTQLHRERELTGSTLALIPVGAPRSLGLAHALGVPRGAVAAARTALDGTPRRLDLLVDDSDGVVLADLRVPAPAPDGGPHPTGVTAVWDTCRTLITSLVRPAPAPPAPSAPAGSHRLRVEADGVLLTDLDRPVTGLAMAPRGDGGPADVVIHTVSGETVTTRAKAVTVSGPDFRYRADIQSAGPVRTRTWTVRTSAWGLVLPAPPEE